ncbi:AraC family transcriptional regulator [Macrococcus sp. DPC7161]|nr:AraC family transcriptional regulator [Macrococcus sp. DPC7161]
MNLKPYIQKVIEIIEENLFEDLSLDDYEKLTGYSKFHLTRYFKNHLNTTIFEYITKRRMAKASYLLIHTDISIIDVTALTHFENQESFTRCFKKLYQLPPGKYRKIMRDLIKEDFKMTTPKGWFLSGSKVERYEINKETMYVHSGTQSAKLNCISKKEEMQNGDFGTIMQSISSEDFKGKRIKFSAFIATKEVNSSGLWARIDDQYNNTLQFDNMSNRSISGTNEWNQYSVVLDVPNESHSIHFGVLLEGVGCVWIDNFSITEVDKNILTTDLLSMKDPLPRQPENLDFELLN